MEIKSIAQLIEMKDEIENRKNSLGEVEIESLGTKVKFKKATRVELVNLRKMEAEEQDPYLIYSNVVEPNLKDKQLQETFNKGCQPHMIVDKLFSIQDVGKLSLAIIGEIKATDMSKDIKNL